MVSDFRMDTTSAIVLVHGLWMKGPEMFLLRRRLRKAGFCVYQFSYRSVACDLGQNARELNLFLGQVRGKTVHFVTHSLGGLVVRRLFHDFPQQRPGRIVTLGTPHTGSYVADRLSRNGLLRRWFGHSLPALSGAVFPWKAERELGSIAGNLSIGIALLMRDLPKPNDGTVTESETRLEGMCDHVVVKATHMGLLFSRRAVDQALAFLADGHFRHEQKE